MSTFHLCVRPMEYRDSYLVILYSFSLPQHRSDFVWTLIIHLSDKYSLYYLFASVSPNIFVLEHLPYYLHESVISNLSPPDTLPSTFGSKMIYILLYGSMRRKWYYFFSACGSNPYSWVQEYHATLVTSVSPDSSSQNTWTTCYQCRHSSCANISNVSTSLCNTLLQIAISHELATDFQFRSAFFYLYVTGRPFCISISPIA